MQSKASMILCLLLLSLFSTACGKDDSSKTESNNFEVKDEYVTIDSISSEYNPREQDISFSTVSIKKFDVNLHGFTGNVQVTYSDSLSQDTGSLRLYTVSKNARYSLGNAGLNISGTTLKISETGNYQCSIRIHNRVIQDLNGACYVKVLVVLPRNLEAEVYNNEKLISKRFFPMTNEEFLASMDAASHDDEKLEVIRNFKESYRTTGKVIKLTTTVLGEVLKEFPFKKFEILRDLHAHVYDRSNLEKMIEDQFTYFDRKKAMDIVGAARIADSN